MSRVVYVNGEFLPEAAAKISVFDRGFLFADAVYEVTSVVDGRLVDSAAHMTRLARSLGELRIEMPFDAGEIEMIERELIKRNGLHEGGVYLQVGRGAADRDFAFPRQVKPSLVIFTQAKKLIDNPAAEKGLAVITMPDIRWQRRDIKTVQLLAASLAKQAALDAGADDAWMVENGFVTEGTSNNAHIVVDGRIVTRPLSNEILHGITRRAMLRLAGEDGIEIEERPFTVEEAQAAAEALITSAGSFVLPVVSIDGKPVGTGKPGPVTRRLRALYIDEARQA
ncbi:MAG: D-amino-acid transaminase [Nitratireductor sp.]|nr:D-amino-acid transaminase [Nitratireductor sp.]